MDTLTIYILILAIIVVLMDAYSLYDAWTSKKFIVIKIIQTVLTCAKLFALLILILSILL